MQQWPSGIGKPGIFRQGATTAPAWIPRVTVQHVDHPLEHIVVDRPETVSWLANQSALTLHMTSSRAATVDNPDWVAFDFDPAEAGWAQIVPVAKALKGLLDELKLLSVPKTSGKRGFTSSSRSGRGTATPRRSGSPRRWPERSPAASRTWRPRNAL
jgi:bifunctional non-homologous end joining protein LigD